MKTNMRLASLFGLLAAAMMLFSFSSPKGGDMFEVYLNGNKLVQQFVHVDNSVKTLQVNVTSANDKIDVYYSHCGQTGKERYLTITDGDNRSLHVWKFDEGNAAMSFTIKDVVAFLKNNETKFGIFYSSQQLPKGRLLAMINLENSSLARK